MQISLLWISLQRFFKTVKIISECDFWAKIFHYCDFMILPTIEKVIVMKYFGPKKALAKYLVNAKFG